MSSIESVETGDGFEKSCLVFFLGVEFETRDSKLEIRDSEGKAK